MTTPSSASSNPTSSAASARAASARAASAPSVLPSRPARRAWRVIDIVVAAILGVACGFVFLVWNTVGMAGYLALDTVTPGLGGLATGIWLIGGVLGGLIVRKPGAAIFVEVIAASLSAALGAQWGIETLYSGLAQGIGAEIVFALFLYKRFGVLVAILSGIGAGIGAFILELFTSGNLARTLEFNAIYATCLAVSGALLAGLVGFIVVRALAATGALDRFAVGREAR